jgi:hypothetical protein
MPLAFFQRDTGFRFGFQLDYRTQPCGLGLHVDSGLPGLFWSPPNVDFGFRGPCRVQQVGLVIHAYARGRRDCHSRDSSSSS